MLQYEMKLIAEKQKRRERSGLLMSCLIKSNLKSAFTRNLSCFNSYTSFLCRPILVEFSFVGKRLHLN